MGRGDDGTCSRSSTHTSKQRATTEHVAGQTRSITATIGGAHQFLQALSAGDTVGHALLPTVSAVAVQLKSSPEEQ